MEAFLWAYQYKAFWHKVRVMSFDAATFSMKRTSNPLVDYAASDEEDEELEKKLDPLPKKRHDFSGYPADILLVITLFPQKTSYPLVFDDGSSPHRQSSVASRKSADASSRKWTIRNAYIHTSPPEIAQCNLSITSRCHYWCQKGCPFSSRNLQIREWGQLFQERGVACLSVASYIFTCSSAGGL